jgi:sulfate adenylyltransferase subunit 1
VQNIFTTQNRVLAKIDSVKNIIATDFSGTTEASH